ncbi:MAG: sigma-E factor negative regulatory protein [Gammaproteobacteria bacterium]|nr:sigma-E factor negative regulatory protein [Gammaproteobacteria bacterium]
MMNSQDKETLSAMLDNEADELEIRRVLKAAVGDTQFADTWQRMSLAQALLHDDNLKSSAHGPLSGRDLSAAVMQAIAEEPVPQTTGGEVQDKASDSASQKAQWAQPLAKLGIAASVALAFFLGMETTFNQSDDVISAPLAQGQGVDEAPASDSNPTLLAAAAESASREVDPEARQRLEEYIQSVSITREEPQQLDQLQDSPLYRLVNEIRDSQ